MVMVMYKGSKGAEALTINKPSDFYPVIANKIAAQEQGRRVQVIAGIDNDHYVIYQVAIRSGTQFITPLKDTMPDAYKTDDGITERYLACIDRKKNAYKYYHMIPHDYDCEFTVKYGRCAVGQGQLFGARSCTWSKDMYHAKLQEKLKKGYVDISEYMLADDSTNLDDSVKKRRKKTASSELFDILKRYARDCAHKNVNVPINAKLIAKSRELINDLRNHARNGAVEEFNSTLSLLMLIMQRSIQTGDGTGVERNLAHCVSDMGRIIKREADLCDVMEGALTGKEIHYGDFSDYGIDVFEATSEQRAFVVKHLGSTLKDKVARVWRVIPRYQKDRFDTYVKDHNVTEIKSLWHGSKNENWASIIQKGLLLNPDAQITGKMFGNGIYFAPSSAKSWNYTSYYGTSWAHGSSDRAFMGLYTVAYGKPMNVDCWSGNRNYKQDVLAGHYDCCHAHAGKSLHADEIIFYDESAMVLSYIVEFK